MYVSKISYINSLRTYPIRRIFCGKNNSNYNVRSYSDKSTDSPIYSLQKKKKVFALVLFSGTLILSIFLKEKKQKKLQDFINEFTVVPMKKGIFSAKICFYRYCGYVFPDQIVHSGVFKQLQEFQFQETDIIVSSFPKSGTTWVQEIVYMLAHNCKPSDTSSEVLETRFPYLEYPYPGIKSIASMKGKRFIKTHLPYDLLPQSFVESGAKLIYIWRNPRDVLTSYFYFMKLLTTTGFSGTFDEFFELFISDKVPYGPYFKHLSSYEASKERILIVSYEDLKRNPAAVIMDIAQFLQISISQEEAFAVSKATSFSSMSKNPSVNYEHWKDIGFAKKEGKFLRKGSVGDWKNHFTSKQVEDFAEWEKLRNKSSIQFNYELSTDD